MATTPSATSDNERQWRNEEESGEQQPRSLFVPQPEQTSDVASSLQPLLLSSDGRDDDGFSSRTRYDHRHSSRWNLAALPQLTQALETFEKEDLSTQKTLSRRLVENVLMKFRWYNPHLQSEETEVGEEPHNLEVSANDRKNAPSLQKAWAYYEHVTLARRFVDSNSSASSWERAEPGEQTHPTALYDLLWTPFTALSEWGLGVSLYFATLRIMVVVFVVAGCIQLPNILFYASPSYNGGRQDEVPWTLRASAICTHRQWVACVDCSREFFAGNRFATLLDVNATPNDNVVFVERVLCPGGADWARGAVSLVTLAWILLALVFLELYQRADAVRCDEDKITTTDYTVMVTNPPPDATDPEEWREFFGAFGKVTVCTIALDNAGLLRKLVERRTWQNQLRLTLGLDSHQVLEWETEEQVHQHVRDDSNNNNEAPGTCTKLLWQCLPSFAPPSVTAKRLWHKIRNLTTEIQEQWMTRTYNVAAVFVTFETEEAQRRALSTLKVGKLDVWFQNATAAVKAAGLLFQGCILQVVEPDEHNTVRWLDLQVSFRTRLMQHIVNLFLVAGLVVTAGVVVDWAHASYGPIAYSILLSCINCGTPTLFQSLLMSWESHTFESSWQWSLYVKITIFRWLMLGIMTRIVTPFTSTLGAQKDELLPTVNGVLLAETVIPPLLRLADLNGNFRKHVLGPRARTQEDMNLNFTGTPYNLGERYTDFTKVVFLCFFYATLNPSTFFIGAVILFVQYHTDRFCLMRLWTSAPYIGTQLAVFSRRYFVSGATLALALIASYMYAQFPYDNVCDGSEPQDVNYSGTHSVVLGNGTQTFIHVTEEHAVQFCNQELSLLSFKGRSFRFPAVPSQQHEDNVWMGPSQEYNTTIYGWTSFAILVSFVVIIFGGGAWQSFVSLFRGTYEPSGQDQHIDFSCVQEIFAYVPQIRLPNFAFPFLACDIDDIDQGLIGWNDPMGSYDLHNLIFDVPHEGLRRVKRLVGNTRNVATVSDSLQAPPAAGEEHTTTSTMGGGADYTQQNTPTIKRPIFSVVKHWPPEWKVAERQKATEN